jgi:hypothetical protein
MGGQPLGRNGPAARRASSVRAGVEPGQGQLERSDVGLGLGQQVDDHCPLEPDGRSFRVVLVVRRREGGGLEDRIPVAPEAGDPGQCPLPLGLQ